VEVEQVGPVAVDDGTQGQAILEGGAHVCDVHSIVQRHLSLEPVQQSVGVHLCLSSPTLLGCLGLSDGGGGE